MTQPRLILIAAAIFSLVLHALVLAAVLDVPIGAHSRAHSIFSPPPEETIAAVPVFRADRDQIVEETPAPSDLDSTPLSINDPSQPRRVSPGAAEKVLSNVKVGSLLPAEPATRSAPNPALSEKIDAASPVGTPAPPPPPRALDTSRLLATAEPAVNLPKYIGPTDAVAAPAPSSVQIDPRAHIDLKQLRDPSTAPTRGDIGAVPGASPDGLIGGVPGGVPGGVVGGTVGGTVGGQLGVRPPALPDLPPGLLRPGTPDGRGDGLRLDDDFEYTMRVFKGPYKSGGIFGLGGDAKDEPAWFEVTIQPKSSLRRLKPLHKDVIYVMDTSESIGEWIGPVKRGVTGALDSLNPGDHFNLVMFKDSVSVFSPGGLADPSPEQFEAATKFMSAAQASGYTDLNQALSKFIVRQMPPDRVYQIVLVSDGQPTRGEIDAAQIINFITRENDMVAGIYGVGVSEVNRKLMEMLAFRNKGSVSYPKNSDNAAGAIRDLASRLRYPIMKDAAVDAAGVDSQAIFPRTPRDIYQGDPLRLYGRFTDNESRLWIRFSGMCSDGQRGDFLFHLDFANAVAGDAQIARTWATWKLHHLHSEMLKRGETKEARKAIDQLKGQYDLDAGF